MRKYKKIRNEELGMRKFFLGNRGNRGIKDISLVPQFLSSSIPLFLITALGIGAASFFREGGDEAEKDIAESPTAEL